MAATAPAAPATAPALPAKARIGVTFVAYKEWENSTSGVHRYLKALLRELPALGVQAKPVPLHHRAVKVLGREFGGLLTLEVARRIPTPGVDLIHAIEPFVRKRGTHVQTVHDITEFKYPDLFGVDREKLAREQEIVRAAIDEARVVVTDTAHVKQDLLKWHPPLKASHVIPVHLGVDTEHWRPAPPQA
ncbi:MAG TPA: hypothetical protein VNZ52_12125, partial [Candidatus Thermoplasmatota archaeon]|nr:hypothetical protein [Candidatus Thermoplasmatota archaeon]